MKKLMAKKSILVPIVMALMLVICFVIPVSAAPGEQNGNSLHVIQPAGGAYVIVTKLAPDVLDFKYGWNNSEQFESPALGYWIGVYDVTASHYVWAEENVFDSDEQNPKMLKLKSLDETTLISGHEYVINFFVRDNYSGSVTNVTIVQVYYTAP